MKQNIDILYNKTAACIEMCMQQYQLSGTIEIFQEAISDHIQNNLRRPSDQPMVDFLNDKIKKLELLK